VWRSLAAQFNVLLTVRSYVIASDGRHPSSRIVTWSPDFGMVGSAAANESGSESCLRMSTASRFILTLEASG
jgi:hypothetical protein